MARADAMTMLYAKNKSALEFQWDSLFGPSVYQLIPPVDVERLRQIATSIKLNGNIVEKKKQINEIMVRNGFMRFHAGTNRVVYTHYELPHIVCKVAVDRVGMNDNPAEFKNQYYLKPFVTKCFDVSPCGTVGVFERIQPINSIEEFAYVYEDTFDLITKVLVGKYVLEDIGSKFFNNYGIRVGFGVCLLDYPYMYKLDGNKLICNRPIFPNTKEPVCGGEIDYDNGFNYLVCRCCGKRYSAKDLEDKRKEGLIKIKGGANMLDVVVTVNGKEIRPNKVSTTIQKPAPRAKEEHRNTKLEVVVTVNGKEVGSEPEVVNTVEDKAFYKFMGYNAAVEPVRETSPVRETNVYVEEPSKEEMMVEEVTEEPTEESVIEPEEEVIEQVITESVEEVTEESVVEPEEEVTEEPIEESTVETIKSEAVDKHKFYDPYAQFYQQAVRGGNKKNKNSKNKQKIQRRKASLSDY